MKNNIGVLIISSGLGGAENVIRTFLETIPDKQNLILITNQELVDYYQATHATIVPIGRYKLIKIPFLRQIHKYWLLLMFSRKLSGICRDYSIDCLNLHLEPALLCTLVARCLRLKAKVIVTIHGSEIRRAYVNRYRYFLLYQALTQANKYIFLHQETLEKARHVVTLKNNYLQLTPGINTQHFQPTAKIPNSVSFYGRLVDQKRPQVFLDACHLLATKQVQFKAFLMGTGPLYDQLEEYIRYHNLSDRVEMVGQPNDSAKILNGTEVFASIQDIENLGSVSLLKAMSAENAIVVVDVGKGGKYLRDIGVARLIPLDDANRLAEELNYLFTHKDELQRLAQNSRAYALEHADAHKIYRQYYSYVQDQ